jgi:hypothetical protein
MDQKQYFQRLSLYTLLFFALFLVFSTASRAQNVQINGVFHGTVTDPTGAVVPGAKIVVRNLSSGQVREATTASNGFYTITQLAPGHYSISASKEGFSTATQADVELLVNQDLEANYTLSVGQVTQTVEVTSAPLMLKTASATLGQVVGAQQVVDLPLNGRQFTSLILLTPGAAPKESPQQAQYYISIGGGGISPATNGQAANQNVFTLDGVYNNHFYYQGYAISPPPDAIEEFNVQSNMTDAQYGLSSGSNVNIETKSGGSQLHGDAWEFIRNDKLDAANFFDNFVNAPKPPYRQNQYGVTLGGPVILPGYDGRKKHTYFFGYWEGFRAPEGFTEFANVPTPAEMGGDFSDILTTIPEGTDPLGRPYNQGQLYNPYSTRQVTAGSVDPVTGLVAQSTGLVRDPFPGNQVPSGMIIPQALTYLHAFYPAPNYGPGGNNFPNFANMGSQRIDSDQFGVGLDHTFSNNDTLSGKFYYYNPTETLPNPLLLGTVVSTNHARMVSAAYTHLFSPTLLASVHYGYLWTDYLYNTDPGGLSLLAATNQTAAEPVKDGLPIVPQVGIGPRLSGTNQFGIPEGPMRSHELTVDLQKVKGNHTFGVGLLYMRVHAFDDGWGTSYGFDQYPTSTIGAGNANDTTTGDGLASMLLNLPSSTTVFIGLTAADLTTQWLGGYLQDKWQVSKKLNLQIGLRWDFESPPHWANNQWSDWNPNCPMGGTYTTNLESPAVIATEDACTLMPVSYVQQTSAAYPLLPSFPNPTARSTIIDPRYNGWQPRFGFAYRATPQTVVRGAFVMFDDHDQFFHEIQDERGAWPWGGSAFAYGYNRGQPNFFFNNPPSAASYMAPNKPIFMDSMNPRAKIPYSMEYNFGIEQQVTPNMSLSVGYVGSLSRHQWGQYGYNSPLPQNMGPNAFPYGQPFPFLGGGGVILEMDDNLFNSNYNAFQVKLEKRFSHGLNFLASYTYSKCMDVTNREWYWPQDTYDFEMDYGPCDENFPQVFTVSSIYQLPLGQGRHFAPNAGKGLDALIGGWNVSGIVSAYTGSPFTVSIPFDNANTGTGQRANVVPGCQLKPSGFQQNVYHWYNPDCYVVPPPYTFGNAQRNSLRGPDFRNFDFSLYKDFKLTESKTLQFRSEFFNIFNRANFAPPGGGSTGAFSILGGNPGTSVDTPTFMQIFNAAAAREIQFALKLVF